MIHLLILKFIKNTVTTIILLTTTTLYSQTSSVLIEACNALENSERRLACFKAAINVDNGKIQDSNTKTIAIQAAEKAFTRMQSNLDIGISLNNFQTALLELASPLAELKRVGGSELSAEGIALLDQALQAYSDSAKFWQTSINFYAQRDNKLSYFRGLPIGLTGMEWLVSKYQLSTVNADLLGLHRGVHVDSTRSKLWAIASDKSAKGLGILNGREPISQRIGNKQVQTIEYDGLTWLRPINADILTSFTTQSKNITFQVPIDTPVQAVTAGNVVFAGNSLNGYTNLIIIKHDDRYLTAYYQNSRLMVSVGDTVIQGQVIAASSENFKYEIRLKGVAVNPSAYLPPR